MHSAPEMNYCSQISILYTTEHSLMIVMACPGVMDSRNNQTRKQSKAAIFLMALLVFSMLPIIAPAVSADGARDAQITVTMIPSSLEINPGESGEYTIRVRNAGSDPVTVQISSSEEGTAECGQYSSQASQISGPIDAGTYEETTMNVTLTQTAEGSCDTTVTVSAADGATPPGAPAQETSTVTTTAGDGSGSAVFGVDLKMATPSQTWAGESVVEYSLEVENTGQTNETITLTTSEASGPGCSNAAAISVSLSDTSVSIDANESEFVTISVEVPEGQAADKYCWEVEGVVSNDPSQGSTDTQEFDLTVPELHDCSLSLSKTSITVAPGAEGIFSAIFSNEGNVDWTIAVGKSGPKAGWISVVGAASGLLEYDDGDGTKTFNLKVSPDDSTEAGSESIIEIQGKEGSSVKCTKNIRVVLGQSHDASLSLVNSLLPNIQPGDSGITTLTVTNQGNGVDNFKLSSSAPPQGWSVELSMSSISLGSKHGNERSGDVEVTVNVPQNALADDQVDIVLSVLSNNGGITFAEITLSVTVAAYHDMEIDSTALDQTGRSDTEVRFPISIENQGNVEDTFRCAVLSQTATPNWGTSFEDVDGNKFTEIDIAPRSTLVVYLVVSIDGEEELDSTRLTIRVTNKDDTNSQDLDEDGIPDNQREIIMLAIQSDRNYQMDVRLEDGGLDGRSGIVTLAPSGTKEYGLWVKNTGDGRDYAVFEINGLEGIATRDIKLRGMKVEDPVKIPVGFGIWNLSRGEFSIDESGEAITETSKNGVESRMLELDQIVGHEARPFEQYFSLTITVNPGAETGTGGVLEIVVTSESNSANRSGRAAITLDVQIIYDVKIIDENIVTDYKVSFTERAEFEVELYNTGNIRSQVRVFTSDNLRDWSVSISNGNECTRDGVELLCWIEVDSSILIEVIVRPPSGGEMGDTFKFTLSSEPVETGVVDRENIEFTVQSQEEVGAFGGIFDNEVTMWVLGGLFISIIVAFLMRKEA